ncbi:MAG: hypothetical protein FJ151_04525 [Euryarchaeota archaeon]|nr:hypothetical protein [Euryarchaeota archaeon]
MVERRVCSFCGEDIEPGTGKMFVKKDGTVYTFCTSKCFKNMIALGRIPRRTLWTMVSARDRKALSKAAPAKTAAAPVEKAEEPAPEPAEAPEEAVEAPKKKAEKPAKKARKVKKAAKASAEKKEE